MATVRFGLVWLWLHGQYVAVFSQRNNTRNNNNNTDDSSMWRGQRSVLCVANAHTFHYFVFSTTSNTSPVVGVAFIVHRLDVGISFNRNALQLDFTSAMHPRMDVDADHPLNSTRWYDSSRIGRRQGDRMRYAHCPAISRRFRKTQRMLSARTLRHFNWLFKDVTTCNGSALLCDQCQSLSHHMIH